jgi:hypothetical protein
MRQDRTILVFAALCGLLVVLSNQHYVDAQGTPQIGGYGGAAGAVGAGYTATSTTSLAIGTGSKTFTTQAGMAYSVGARVRASSAANTANYMEGLVTAYSGVTLTVNVDVVGGSGTLTDWNINLAGNRGATGVTGDTGPAGAACDLAGVPTCGTGCATVVANSGNCVGALTTTTLATAATLNFSATRSQVPFCVGMTDSGAISLGATSVTTGLVTFGLSGVLTGTIYYACLPGG